MFDLTNLDPELVLTMWSFALQPLNEVFNLFLFGENQEVLQIL